LRRARRSLEEALGSFPSRNRRIARSRYAEDGRVPATELCLRLVSAALRRCRRLPSEYRPEEAEKKLAEAERALRASLEALEEEDRWGRIGEGVFADVQRALTTLSRLGSNVRDRVSMVDMVEAAVQATEEGRGRRTPAQAGGRRTPQRPRGEKSPRRR
jgi:hypothetical protein